jgi:hypothetical protein
MAPLLEIPLLVVAVLAVFLASTIGFDVVHATLHHLADSRVAWLRTLGGLHETHHRFLDRELRVHDELIPANLRRHVVPEYLTQLAFAAAALAVLPLRIVLPVVAIQTLVFAWILNSRGLDVNHRGWQRVPAYRPSIFCMPEYHAWHHAHPEAHFASWIKPLDWLLGTGSSLAGRRIVLTGGATPFGAALHGALAERGLAKLTAYGAGLPGGRPDLTSQPDVLVLAHEAPGEEYARAIEAFCDSARERRLPPEVWALGSAPDFLPHARRFFRDPRVIYRHIAPSPGATPARRARIALDHIRRGFNLVPTTRAPLAVLRELVCFHGALRARR